MSNKYVGFMNTVENKDDLEAMIDFISNQEDTRDIKDATINSTNIIDYDADVINAVENKDDLEAMISFMEEYVEV